MWKHVQVEISRARKENVMVQDERRKVWKSGRSLLVNLCLIAAGDYGLYK